MDLKMGFIENFLKGLKYKFQRMEYLKIPKYDKILSFDRYVIITH